MLFILNESYEVVGILNSNGDLSRITTYFDDAYVQDLGTGAETFTFSTMADTEQAQYLVAGNFIAFKEDGEFKLFNIIQIEETHEEVFTKTVYCEMAGVELINEIIRPMKITNSSLRKFLTAILEGTEWQLGRLDAGFTQVFDFESTDYKSVYELIQEYAVGTFGAEISYRVEIENGRIVGKYIDCYKERGNSNGFRFAYGSNLTSVVRTVDMSNLATALIGVGKNGITFKSVETGDKPLNQDFITNETAYRQWNINGSHIFGVHKEETESPQELLRLTRIALEERANPQIKYELKAELLGKDVKIGDTVNVVDHEFNPPLYLTARVNQLTKSKTDPQNNEVVLANFREVNSNITEEMKNLASQLEGYVDSQFPIGGDKIQNGAIGKEQFSKQYHTEIVADAVYASLVETEELIAGKADIGDLHATNATIENLKVQQAEIENLVANKAEIEDLKATNAQIENLKANKADIDDLHATNATIGELQANKADIGELNAVKGEITHLKSEVAEIGVIKGDVADIEHILAGNITADNIQTGAITAGSGIIADGAIGNAQISKIDAGKIEAGTIDTSKVTIQGSNGHLRLKGNRMQVFEGTGNQAKERVSVGDVNGDGSVYGLRVRGADGQTILLDENGVTSEGITDGSITNDKISDDANIDGAKLNINSVVSKINEDGTETIQGTKIEVDGTTLNTKLSTITNKQTEDSERITQAQSQITANTNAIKLKVDEQTYTTDKKDMTAKLEKNTSEITAMKGEIALKVEQTDIENAINEATLSRADFIARNFLSTPLIVSDSTLPIYTFSGIPNPPIGSVFGGFSQEKNIIKDKNISSNGSAWAIIVGYEFYKNTTDNDKKNKIRDIIKKVADFMANNVSIGRFNSMDFNFIDTNYKYDSTSKSWVKSNYKEIYISTLWLQVKAMVYAYEILKDNTYSSLCFNILDSLFNTHFYINAKVASNELPTHLEWSSYEYLACDNLSTNYRFVASTKQYANQMGYYIHQAIPDVIRVFGDNERPTPKGDIYKPSDILVGLKKYLKNAYDTQNITAKPLGLPYGYFHRVENGSGGYDYIPQNWNFIEDTWGDVWFVGDVVTYIIYAFAASGLTDIAREYADNYYKLRVNVKDGKWSTRFNASELIFYDRMDFYTGSHLSDDDSISITYTALYYEILKQIGKNEHIDACCYTLAKHQINNLDNKNIDGGYPWDISRDDSSLEFKSFGEIINSQFYKNLNITSFTAIDNKFAEIKVTTDSISQNVSNLSQTVSNKADGSTVTVINNKVTSLETSVNGISGKVTSLEKTTTDLGESVEGVQGEISTLKSDVASLEVTTSGISQKVSSVESTTATLSGKVNTANNNATNALSQANTNKGNINSLQGTVNTTNSKVATLETNLNGITQRVSSTESTTATLTTKVNNAQNTADNVSNKLNNLQIGARNLLKGTSSELKSVTFGGWDYYFPNNLTSWKVGGQLTGRVYIKPTNQEASCMLHVRYTDSTYSQYRGNVIKAGTEGYSTVTITVNPPSGKTVSHIQFSIRHSASNTPSDVVYYKEAKVESGNKATDWSPAPEDIDSSISAVDSKVESTKSKVATIETNLSGITSRVSNVENKQTTVAGKVSSLETRMSTAESKITETAITNTVKKNFYTKSETDSQITSKGYQTASQVQQTVDGLEVKVTKSGGYNLIYNGDFKRRLECWEPNSDRWQYGEDKWTPNGRHVACIGDLNTTRTMYIKNDMPLDRDAEAYTLSYWINTSTSGVDGTTNPYRRAELTVYYDDGSATWHSVGYNQTRYATWEKHVLTVTKPPDKGFSHFGLGLWCRDTTKKVHYAKVMMEKGTMANEWTPNPNEIYAGVTTIDNDGIKVTATNTNTCTEMDASSFRVRDNNGGTIAEFAKSSTIPNLNAGIISANEIYASNIVRKSTHVKKYYVAGGYGNDVSGAGGDWNNPCKTVQYVLDNYVEDVLDYDVNIYVGQSVPGWTCKSKSGKGVISFLIQDDCIVGDPLYLDNCTNRIVVHGTDAKKGTFMTGIVVTGCHNFDIGWVSFRGKNWAHNSGSCNVLVRSGSKGIVRFNDFNGCSFAIIVDNNSEIWLYQNRGSDITHYIGIGAYTTIYGMRSGSDVCPDFTGYYYADAGHSNLYHIHDGANYTKTPSIGWSPSYTPTQKTQTWSFNKIWSDETLHGWSDRQELIQGYASTWNTGRWTGYMQMTDDFAAIRNTISGGTNLSGRIYVQRTSSSGNSTGSKLCLYASDGTLITNSTSINRSQGVWVSLSSSIIQKIQSGAIKYFYLKADSNNTATYFKCESNAKIEITYTK